LKFSISIAVATIGFATLFLAGLVSAQTAVTTYHYDNLRTGWNQTEATLTPENVGSNLFGALTTVSLDDQVDAQPLIIPNQTITGGSSPGTYEVVYVATESNTIYAINAHNGLVLLSKNLGAPVPMPLGCANNGPNVGVTGTPVIDVSAHTLYVIAYTIKNGAPTYQLHALKLNDLTDKIAPVTVAASHKLSNGVTFNFDAKFQRQRVALLQTNGRIYAAFGSFCDAGGASSRGWLLGWRANTLAPLAANQMNDTLATSPSYFLSSIWMSGYGVAADSSGDLYFVTGNSAAPTYDGVHNIQESVAKVSGDLTNLLSIFTPSDVGPLDQGDVDFGSGGVLLLEPQNGPIPRLAAAAGKDGRLFLLNCDSLGGYTPGGPNKVLDTKSVGACWCGESYFTGSDGIGRVVSSGGVNVANITVWKVQTSPSPKFVQEAVPAKIANGQDGGTFTVVSSNGTQAGTGVIWAIGRPNAASVPVTLNAFAAAPSNGTLTSLFSATAGSWPNLWGNANIVPVVANGKVYVASNQTLRSLASIHVSRSRMKLPD
jgi:hypothetical protein